MNEHDRFVVANNARIPCTVRTLKPFYIVGETRPWVHSGEVSDALQYLAARAGLPPEDLHALKELLERLSSLLKDLSASAAPHPDDETRN